MANINKSKTLKNFMVKVNIQKNINLQNHTTIKVGGKTEYFSEPANISELENILKWARNKNINCQFFGAGSNLLISGKIWKDLFICTKKLKAINLNPETGILEAESGVMLPTISTLLAKNSPSMPDVNFLTISSFLFIIEIRSNSNLPTSMPCSFKLLVAS